MTCSLADVLSRVDGCGNCWDIALKRDELRTREQSSVADGSVQRRRACGAVVAGKGVLICAVGGMRCLPTPMKGRCELYADAADNDNDGEQRDNGEEEGADKDGRSTRMSRFALPRQHGDFWEAFSRSRSLSDEEEQGKSCDTNAEY